MSAAVDLDAEFSRALAAFSDGAGFDALPERDQVLVTIWGLEAEVNNGGFDQYFYNGAGDQAFFAAEALARIGAMGMSEIVRQANSLLGGTGPARERAARVEQLDALTDEQRAQMEALDGRFFDYPDDIAGLLMRYLAVT